MLSRGWRAARGAGPAWFRDRAKAPQGPNQQGKEGVHDSAGDDV